LKYIGDINVSSEMNVQVTLKSTPIRRSSLTEMGEILEVLVLEYDFAGTRTRTRTRAREVSTRTRTREVGTRTCARTRKSPYSPISDP